MKKIVLSLAILLAGAPLTFAQTSDEVDHSIEFVTKDGTIVPDGSVLNLTEVEENVYGEPMINSGLFIKNMTDKIVQSSMTSTIVNMPSGQMQFCFAGVCKAYPQFAGDVSYPVTNYVDERDTKPIKTEAADPYLKDDGSYSADKNLQNEWLLEEGKYGTTTETLQIKIYDLNGFVTEFKAYGPKVTVNFIYADPAGINGNVAEQKLSGVTYYDLAGRQVSNPANGVYVKKAVYADGTVKTEKVTVK